jgi:hypothetical protein
MEIRETAPGRHGQKLRESNIAFEAKARQKVLESMRKEIKSMTGLDIMESAVQESGALDIFGADFSIKECIRTAEKYCAKVREANVAGTVQQFLRAGIQMGVNSLYAAAKVDTTWDGMYQSLPSNKAVELYAAAFRASFPELKGFGEQPTQAQIAGMDIQIPNRQVAKKLLKIGKDLILFDQTSQVQAQAQQIAENFPIFSDSHAVGRFLSNPTTVSYAVLDAFNSTGFTNGKGINSLGANGAGVAFSYEAIIQLRVLARQMKDPLGHKMMVNPDTLWCGTGITDAAELMLKSELYPSTASIKAVTAAFAAGTDTTIGTQHAGNILKGKFNLVDSIWLPELAYGICQAAKGFIKQVVQPVKVMVENPMSGGSFLLGGTNYLIDEIWTYEHIEPRFILRGSDGSA